MSTPVTFNGVSYSVPAYNDTGYAQGPGNLSLYLIALASGTLQQTGGTFSLTADVNFGLNFGLISKYFTSVSANPATAGAIRLANGDTIDWRNTTNSANLALGVNGSNQLTFGGAVIPTGGSSFVSSITGTAHEIIASSSTGAVTLSTPQPIDTTSDVSFRSVFSSVEVDSPLIFVTGPGGQFKVPASCNLSFQDSGTNFVTLTGPTTISSTYALTMPTAQGANHTVLHNDGTGQLSFNLVGLSTDVTGNLPVTNLNSGTAASSSTFWRGDGTWAAPSGSGTVNTGVTGVLSYYPATSNAVSPIPAGAGISGQLLTSFGAGAAPQFQGGIFTAITGLGAQTQALAMGSNKITGLANGTTAGDALAFGQSFTAGEITFSPTTTGMAGTSTNDNAATGIVGEVFSSAVSSPVSGSTTAGTFTDTGCSIALTAGDWDVDAYACLEIAGAAGTGNNAILGEFVITDSSNSIIAMTAAGFCNTTVPHWFIPCHLHTRISISGSTTYKTRFTGLLNSGACAITGLTANTFAGNLTLIARRAR